MNAKEHNRWWLDQVETTCNEKKARAIFAVALRPDGHFEIFNTTDFNKVLLAKELVSIAFKLANR